MRSNYLFASVPEPEVPAPVPPAEVPPDDVPPDVVELPEGLLAVPVEPPESVAELDG